MRSRGIVVLAALGATLITGGWLVGHGLQGQGSTAPADGPRLFEQVAQHVAQYYVDSITGAALYEKALDGMVQELGDPHSVVLTPERLRRLAESTTGNYAGVGLRVDVRDGWLTVIDPIAGAPAERAGIRVGDRLVEIAGEATHGWTVDEASKRLRGIPRTHVALLVERPGVDGRIPFSVERGEVHVRSVRRVALMRDSIGYLDLAVFSGATADEVRQGVDSLRRLGARSVVLDLRANPGGLLDQGVSVADLFLDPGQPVVSIRGRTPEANHVFVDTAAQRWTGLPLVVLVNEGSASAAEIVAGALQDHDRALIVGTTSYGKGSAQSVFPLPNGSALKLTTSLWYTPSGRSINKPLATADDDDDEADDAKPVERTRKKFKTDAGRTVYGGGGITPDIAAGDTIVPPAELAFLRALGRQVGAFRDALTDFALAVKASHGVSTPDFPVTAAMRDELWRRMTARGIAMDRASFDAAGPLVTRQLAYEITRYSFGPEAEFRRRAADDPVINAALGASRGVRTQRELFSRAPATHG
ncbi:MAG: S41 family peptidase [Gemmatirosa sp.]|nr:S41 family peptidase [Gemmatirosa sp.]